VSTPLQTTHILPPISASPRGPSLACFSTLRPASVVRFTQTTRSQSGVLVAVMARMTGGKEKMNLADEMSKCPGFVFGSEGGGEKTVGEKQRSEAHGKGCR